ncbi:hypothetical protein AMECASPLE_016711 [Ameca splendens]|uniref:Uncharacterized protein n=1 Tax=Ameca splendens TaxID=208324 RepID=A0ABV0YDC0_9TELE
MDTQKSRGWLVIAYLIYKEKKHELNTEKPVPSVSTLRHTQYKDLTVNNENQRIQRELMASRREDKEIFISDNLWKISHNKMCYALLYCSLLISSQITATEIKVCSTPLGYTRISLFLVEIEELPLEFHRKYQLLYTEELLLNEKLVLQHCWENET